MLNYQRVVIWLQGAWSSDMEAEKDQKEPEAQS